MLPHRTGSSAKLLAKIQLDRLETMTNNYSKWRMAECCEHRAHRWPDCLWALCMTDCLPLRIAFIGLSTHRMYAAPGQDDLPGNLTRNHSKRGANNVAASGQII